MAKVPEIRHSDTVVTEAAAICAYFADAFPEARLAPPPGSPARPLLSLAVLRGRPV
jgi:glutathione S-transferase